MSTSYFTRSNGVISMYALTTRGASAPGSRPCQGGGREREKGRSGKERRLYRRGSRFEVRVSNEERKKKGRAPFSLLRSRLEPRTSSAYACGSFGASVPLFSLGFTVERTTMNLLSTSNQNGAPRQTANAGSSQPKMVRPPAWLTLRTQHSCQQRSKSLTLR